MSTRHLNRCLRILVPLFLAFNLGPLPDNTIRIILTPSQYTLQYRRSEYRIIFILDGFDIRTSWTSRFNVIVLHTDMTSSVLVGESVYLYWFEMVQGGLCGVFLRGTRWDGFELSISCKVERHESHE